MSSSDTPGRPRRLGIKIHKHAVGWALIEGLADGITDTHGDPFAAAMALIDRKRPDVVELKFYASEEAFERSHAYRQRMSRSAHNALVTRIATAAQARGLKVELETL